MMSKKILAVDFDGVIHSYTSGWQGPLIIPDIPVSGSFDFLRNAVKHFDVMIFSSRSAHDGAINAMCEWFETHGLARAWVNTHLKFPTEKPPASVTLDDRAIQFVGIFPSLAELDAFEPWTKSVPATHLLGFDGNLEDTTRLSLEISIGMMTRHIHPIQGVAVLGRCLAGAIVAIAQTRQQVVDITDAFTNTLETHIAHVLALPQSKNFFE